MSAPVSAHLFYSVNGVARDPHLFQFDAFGEAEGELMTTALEGVTDLVIGRKLWQEWKDYWATADDPFGAFINPVRKHVISSTLQGPLEWNSTVAVGDPVDYVRRLAATAAGRVSVAGGVQTVRSLFVGGAIDTLTLTMHPAVTPDGGRLFDESVPLTRLQLVDSVITPAGNAVLTYSLRP
ncbi:dihydrofolate reductase family protein [Micropruina sonneratiae]|uniref:dihydrofolate reductase family protein n=1 Tax=Micropruina sonneratiae TaxID=2986940 RepID=UPI002227F822|nr:dihydrofolate reductase family protein [Micropruina sp. KQZ13P-5]MCW3158042.1 dihydrofolate reductase family protein [Micropruina sp. KQZ13P-5]